MAMPTDDACARVAREFLGAALPDRLRMARDPANDEALASVLGGDGLAALKAEAARVDLDRPATLAADAPTNLVFVPGIMGSFLRSKHLGGVWWIDAARGPGLIDKLGLGPDGDDPDDTSRHVVPGGVDLAYNPFLTEVLRRRDFGHVAHPFDWRKSLRKGTAGLKKTIEDAHASNGGQAVHLVGHSMGGLLIRATLAEHGDALWPKVGRIAFLGTPHYGSPAIAFYLKDHFYGASLKILLAAVLSRETFRSLRGALELLPAPLGIYPGTDRPGLAYDSGGHPCVNFDPYKAVAWDLGLDADATAALQAGLDSAAAFHRWLHDAHVALPNDKYNKMLMIAGVGHPTPIRLLLAGGHGNPFPMTKKEVSRRRTGEPNTDGDGTVPLASASLPYVATRYVHGEHGDLPNMPEVSAAVFRWLKGEPPGLANTAKGALEATLGGGPAAPGTDYAPDDYGQWDPAPPSDDWLAERLRLLEAGQLLEFNKVHIF